MPNYRARCRNCGAESILEGLIRKNGVLQERRITLNPAHCGRCGRKHVLDITPIPETSQTLGTTRQHSSMAVPSAAPNALLITILFQPESDILGSRAVLVSEIIGQRCVHCRQTLNNQPLRQNALTRFHPCGHMIHSACLFGLGPLSVDMPCPACGAEIDDYIRSQGVI